MFRQMLLEKEENSGIAPVFDEAGRPVYVLYYVLCIILYMYYNGHWEQMMSFTSEAKK